jgi:hypothetical protein
MDPTVTQLYLFPVPGQCLAVKRVYIRHKQQHVMFLQKNYAFYTLKELELMLTLPAPKILELCRRHGIRKRAPNRKPHKPDSGTVSV